MNVFRGELLKSSRSRRRRWGSCSGQAVGWVPRVLPLFHVPLPLPGPLTRWSCTWRRAMWKGLMPASIIMITGLTRLKCCSGQI